MPDLVAVLYEPGSPDSVVVELLDAQKLQTIGGWQSGVSPSTIPTSGKILIPPKCDNADKPHVQYVGLPRASRLPSAYRVAISSRSPPTIRPM